MNQSYLCFIILTDASLVNNLIVMSTTKKIAEYEVLIKYGNKSAFLLFLSTDIEFVHIPSALLFCYPGKRFHLKCDLKV